MLERDAVWKALRDADEVALAGIVEPYADMIEADFRFPDGTSLDDRVVAGLTLDRPPVLPLYRWAAVEITAGDVTARFRRTTTGAVVELRHPMGDNSLDADLPLMSGMAVVRQMWWRAGAASCRVLAEAWCRVLRGYSRARFVVAYQFGFAERLDTLRGLGFRVVPPQESGYPQSLVLECPP